MQRKHLVCSVSALAAAALALRAGPAAAYLEPASILLERLAQRRADLGFRTLVAEGYRPDTRPPIPVWTGILANRAIRTEHRAPEATQVVLDRGRERYLFTRGAPVPPPLRLRAEPFLELLGSTQEDPGGQRGLALLARMKVDPRVVSLTRHDGRPAYVIGAAPGQLDVPQLWIDKDDLVPVRWLMDVGGVFEDVRLYGYSMPTAGPWFPERVERWRGEKLESRVIYTDTKLNVPVDEQRFAPPSPGS